MSRLLRTELTVPGASGGACAEENEAISEDIRAWLAANSPQGWEELTSPASGELAPRPLRAGEDATADVACDLIFRFYQEPLAATAAAFTEYAAARWPTARLAMESMEREDWASAWKEFFTPVAIAGRFEIVPPWLKDADHHGLKPLIIEPKMAFGTGHHATTALCLEAVASLVANGRLSPSDTFLDLGTGSGILAIGLAMLGLRGVALDIDPQAILCAAENLALNNLTGPDAPGGPDAPVRLAVGSLPVLAEHETFDLAVANILAQPLIDMAPHLARHLKPGATLILSGLLTTQAACVARAYTALGMSEPIRKDSGEWSALLWG